MEKAEAVTSRSDLERARGLQEACARLREELGKVIVGQEGVIEELLVAIFSRGHCLMQGVPGLAKMRSPRTGKMWQLGVYVTEIARMPLLSAWVRPERRYHKQL